MGVVNKLIEKSNKENKSGKAGEFISYLFSTRDGAHLLHLKSTSYAQHKALDDYYSGIVDLIDGLAESIQGKYGILNIPNVTCDCNLDPLSYFEKCVESVCNMRKNIPQDSYIQNQVDEVESLMYSTIYKLKFLK